MADPKDREREARVAHLARELFIASSARDGWRYSAADCFLQAEDFDDLAQARWKELCK